MTGRAQNFASVEIHCLLRLVEKYQDIVESKKTDNVTTRKKEDTWQRIADEYNDEGVGVFRNQKTLRTKYFNLKAAAKRNSSTDKVIYHEKYPDATIQMCGKELADPGAIDCHENADFPDFTKNFVYVEQEQSSANFLTDQEETSMGENESNENQKYSLQNLLPSTKRKELTAAREYNDEKQTYLIKLATMKGKLAEQKLKKEIEIMENEHQLRMRLLRLEKDERELRLQQMKEKHELEMQILRQKCDF